MNSLRQPDFCPSARSIMRLLIVVAFLLSACSAAPDRGIAAKDSGFGYAERGRLSSDDARWGDHYVDGFSVSVATVRPLALTLDAGSFDAEMVVIAPSGEAQRVTTCEGTADACIRIESPARGMWYVRVTSAAPGTSGSYTFAVGAPLTGIVAPQQLASRDEPLGAPPRPVAPSAPPEPVSDRSTDATAEQEASGTFTGGTQRVRLDGRDRPAILKPLYLLAGDGFFVRFESEDVSPLLVLSRNGAPVMTVREQERPLGGASADLRFWVEETGSYDLYFSTTDADLEGAYEYDIWFERDDTRIYEALDLYEYPPAPGTSFSDTHTAALRALLDAAPSFRSVRGPQISGGAVGETVYESTIQLSETVETSLRCRGERCSVLAVFPTPDVEAAGTAATDLLSYIDEAGAGGLDQTPTSSGGRMSVEFSSERVWAEVAFDPTRYDARLGVPVRLRIEGR